MVTVVFGGGVERRQLEYFLAVVEHGGVTRASAHLHVSQPTISAAIRRLETELGGLLFERAPGGLILTGAGRALLEPASQVVRDFAVATETARDALGLRGGRLDICAVSAVSAGWLPPAIAAFRRAHPEIDIAVRSETDDQLIAERVRGGRDNLGLAVSASSDAGLVTRQVGHQDLQAIFPPGSGRAGEPIGLEELVERDLVTWHQSTARRWFETELRRRGQRLSTPIEAGSADGVLPAGERGRRLRVVVDAHVAVDGGRVRPAADPSRPPSADLPHAPRRTAPTRDERIPRGRWDPALIPAGGVSRR